MRRGFLLLFIVSGLIMVFFLSSGFLGKKLYMYNWAEYIPQDVLNDFRKETGIKVIYDTYASNEEMYAKLKAGARGYDIIFPSGDHVSIMIKEGMLEKIDKSRLSNFRYIDKNILKKITYDPNNEYSIPYMLGSTGICVNKTKVKKYERSWSIFERKDLKGKMTLLDDMREVIGAALKYLGYSVNSTSTKELEEAEEVLKGWKENIVKFDAEFYGKGIASGEYWVVHGYGENIFSEIPEEEWDKYDFFIPKEGGTLWIDNMVIPKGAKHVDYAYKFINFILRPDIMARICDYLRLPCPNTEARRLVKKKPIYTIDDLKNCEFIDDVGEYIKLYKKVWNEIRFGY